VGSNKEDNKASDDELEDKESASENRGEDNMEYK
jgi:hypothetical protein